MKKLTCWIKRSLPHWADRGNCRPLSVEIEKLESRTLLTAVLVQSIGNQVFPQDSGPEQADMTGVFADNNGASDLTFSATSSNPAVLTASVSGSILTITPVTGLSGFARVQMVAADPTGVRVSNTFRVQVTAADTRSLDVTLGAGGVPSLHFAESDGASASLSVKGPGSAVLHFGGDGLSQSGGILHGANQELESITLNNTTGATTLTVAGQKTKGNVVTIGTITASGSLGHLRIANANLQGDLTVTGTLPDLNVDFAEGGTITIGSGAVSIRGLSFVDENFVSTSPITAIKLLQWANSDNVPESFSAAFVRSISVRGNFTPGLQLSGVGAPALTLDHVSIRGGIDGTWNIAGASAPLTVGSTSNVWNATFASLPSLTTRGDMSGHLTAATIRSINVRGIIAGATIMLTASSTSDLGSLKAKSFSYSSITATGNIGTISTRLIEYSSIFAGLDAVPIGTLTDSASDIVAVASIKAVDVAGGLRANDFVASYIAASVLGTLQLGTTNTSNGGFPFGVAGNSIGKLTVTAGHRSLSLRSIHDAATLAAQLAAQHASLGDMAIRIL